MADKPAGDEGKEGGSELAVDRRVRFNPGTEDECLGVVVDDFGEMDAQSVDIGEHHFADPARRWAVLLDGGALVFADSEQLVAV
jgi:hypothetical protein